MVINALLSAEQKIFGVFELSATGTVLYCRAAEKRQNEAFKNIVGQNFFDELAIFESVKELRQSIESFIKSNRSVDTFNFLSFVKDEIVQAKVMLVRVSEQDNRNRTKSVIVDIRRA